MPAVILVCTATAILVFLFLSERNQAQRLEAERAQMEARLRITSARLHDLSAEVDSLSARPRGLSPSSFAAIRPSAKLTLPRGAYSSSPLPARPIPAGSSPTNSAKEPAAPSFAKPVNANSATPASRDYSADIGQLNGSIATTHEQLVELERQGARHYVEFTMARSSDFQEVGPLWVQIRKVNLKRGYYDLSIIVNGHRLEKSHVNLFEPIWINTTDRPMQFQLVANSIAKNEISGYLSEPKSGTAN